MYINGLKTVCFKVLALNHYRLLICISWLFDVIYCFNLKTYGWYYWIAKWFYYWNKTIPGRRLNIKELDVTNGGYCVSSLEAAMYAFLSTNSFLDGLVRVVNNGKDSDTVGAIYGQIAGAFYGYNQIPQELFLGLMKNHEIKASIDNLILSSKWV